MLRDYTLTKTIGSILQRSEPQRICRMQTLLMENALKDSSLPDVWLKKMEITFSGKVQVEYDNYSAIVIWALKRAFVERYN